MFLLESLGFEMYNFNGKLQSWCPTEITNFVIPWRIEN